MGQFDKNSGVISLFRSLINPFTFKNDEFQFYIHKKDEFHENAHLFLETVTSFYKKLKLAYL